MKKEIIATISVLVLMVVFTFVGMSNTGYFHLDKQAESISSDWELIGQISIDHGTVSNLRS